jgi:hypothetical protein
MRSLKLLRRSTSLIWFRRDSLTALPREEWPPTFYINISRKESRKKDRQSYLCRPLVILLDVAFNDLFLLYPRAIPKVKK